MRIPKRIEIVVNTIVLLSLICCGKSSPKAETHTVCIEPLDETYNLYFAFDGIESYCAIYENDEAQSIGEGDEDSCVVATSDFATTSFVDKTFVLTVADPASVTEWDFESCEKIQGSLADALN